MDKQRKRTDKIADRIARNAEKKANKDDPTSEPDSANVGISRDHPAHPDYDPNP